MEGKNKAKPIHFSNSDIDSALTKVLKSGIEVEFELGGQKVKGYWQKIGFSDRPLFKAYATKKIREAEELGVIERKFIKKEILPSEPEQTVFFLNPVPAIDSEIKVEGTDVPYIFTPELATIVFDNPLSKQFTVSYSYFDTNDYSEIINNAYACMLIFLSLRKSDDHKKRFFNSIQDVESLGQQEINDILTPYIEKLKVTEEDLKKSHAPQPSYEGGTLQNDME